MEEWRRILAQSGVKPKDLADRLGVDPKEVEDIVGEYPMRITPTVLATIKEKGDAIWKQVVPDRAEMADADAEVSCGTERCGSAPARAWTAFGTATSFR